MRCASNERGATNYGGDNAQMKRNWIGRGRKSEIESQKASQGTGHRPRPRPEGPRPRRYTWRSKRIMMQLSELQDANETLPILTAVWCILVGRELGQFELRRHYLSIENRKDPYRHAFYFEPGALPLSFKPTTLERKRLLKSWPGLFSCVLHVAVSQMQINALAGI